MHGRDTIFFATDGQVGEKFKDFTRPGQGKGEVLPSINAAKRWVRKNAQFKTFKV